MGRGDSKCDGVRRCLVAGQHTADSCLHRGGEGHRLSRTAPGPPQVRTRPAVDLTGALVASSRRRSRGFIPGGSKNTSIQRLKQSIFLSAIVVAVFSSRPASAGESPVVLGHRRELGCQRRQLDIAGALSWDLSGNFSKKPGIAIAAA